MKIRHRLLTLALAGAMTLSLASCNKAPAEPKVEPNAAGITLLPANKTDVVKQVLGVPADTTMLTVNGTALTAEQYLYFLTSSIASYEQYLAMNGQSGLDWTQTIQDQPFGEYMKQQNRDQAASYLIMEAKAKEMGISLTAEQLDELKTMRQADIDQLGGEDKYVEALQQEGVSDGNLWWANSVSLLYQSVQDALYSGDKAPTNDELSAYAKVSDTLRAKHILIPTVDLTAPADPATGKPAALDDETIAKNKAQADDLLAQIRASADPVKLFDELMNKFSQDTGLAANPDGYTFTAGDMVAPFEEATRKLKFNEISDVVQSDFGYHIILRLDPVTDALTKQYTQEQFSTQIETWVGEAEITSTELFDKLDAKACYDGYNSFRIQMKAEAAAKADAAKPSADPAASPAADPATSPAA